VNQSFGILRAFLVCVVFAITATISLASQAQTQSQANKLLRLMRVDDSFQAKLRGFLGTMCSTGSPKDGREQCPQKTRQLLHRAAARPQLAELMTPYVKARFSEDEIAELVNFWGSAVGNEAAAYLVWSSWAKFADPKNPPRFTIPAVSAQ